MIRSIDTDLAVHRFLELTPIQGPSGREQEVMKKIVSILVAAGVPEGCLTFDDANTRCPGGGETGNLIVRIPGTMEGSTTLLSAHTDTVPICVGSDPFVDGDWVRNRNPASGLGADDRSGCAAIATAAIELIQSGNAYAPFTLLFCIQEEIGLFGARHLNRETLGKVDRAFNFDGGPVDKLTIGAIGGERMTITVYGIASHAGVSPQSGASAIVMAARAIESLHTRGWLGAIGFDEIGTGTANIGVINGGDATNVITPLVTLRAEARSHDEVMRKRIVAEIKNAFEQAAAATTNEAGKSGRIDFVSRVEYEAFALAEDDDSVLGGEAVVNAVIRASGRTAYKKISNGGLDANWLYRHGIGAVTLGCGQHHIHTIDECLSIPDYLDACRVAYRLIACDDGATG